MAQVQGAPIKADSKWGIVRPGVSSRWAISRPNTILPVTWATGLTVYNWGLCSVRAKALPSGSAGTINEFVMSGVNVDSDVYVFPLNVEAMALTNLFACCFEAGIVRVIYDSYAITGNETFMVLSLSPIGSSKVDLGFKGTEIEEV